MLESEEKPLVVIRSLVYNHEPYLRDCLEGFVMQQTTFPFVAVVHDDCSTDGSAAIIREYAEKYPHIIQPVYETENQYSKHDGSMRRIMDEACGKYGAKYIALCEGDDCWTDPHKLQKQVDFLEAHPDYSMVCCDGTMKIGDRMISTQREFDEEGWPHRETGGEMFIDELVLKSGQYIFTASMVYRASIMNDSPAQRNAASANPRPITMGDYYYQILSVLKGRVHYIAEKMVLYRRYSTPTAWSSQMRFTPPTAKHVDFWAKDTNMLTCMDEYSGGKYSHIFRKMQEWWILVFLENNRHLRNEILSKMGYTIMYAYQAPYHRRGDGLAGKLRHLLGRVLFYPYYPYWSCATLMIAPLRPFYQGNNRVRKLHVGRFGILSHVKVGENKGIYLFGVKIK